MTFTKQQRLDVYFYVHVDLYRFEFTNPVDCCSTNHKEFLHSVRVWCSRQHIQCTLQTGAEYGSLRCLTAIKK